MGTGLRRWIVAAMVAATACAARADTRYYLLNAKYGWTMRATHDDALYEMQEGDTAPEQRLLVQYLSPIDLTVVLKVEDLNMPGRKARVTYYFQSVAYTDELRGWRVDDFADGGAIGKMIRAFLSQPRHLNTIPTIAAYEEEAVACLLLAAEGHSFVIDLDVTPDKPDPLVYQADALIYDTFVGDAEPPVQRKNGVAWFDSDAAMERMQADVLAGEVKRVERIRHLLWGHLKMLALFVENHQYEYFYPRELSDDTPLLASLIDQSKGVSVRRYLDLRRAPLTGTTPAYAFPAAYRWASMSEQDFADTVGQAHWQRVDGGPVVDLNAANTQPRDDRRADRALDRLELTRESLAELSARTADTDLIATNPASSGLMWSRLSSEIGQRRQLGERYLETLTRLHKAGGPPPFTTDHTWRAAVTTSSSNSPLIQRLRSPNLLLPLSERSPSEDDAASQAQFGLWLTSLDGAHFDVDQRVDAVNAYQVKRRTMSVATTIDDAPLYVPGLASDHSSNVLAIVDVQSQIDLDGRRLTEREAQQLIPQQPESSPDAE